MSIRFPGVLLYFLKSLKLSEKGKANSYLLHAIRTTFGSNIQKLETFSILYEVLEVKIGQQQTYPRWDEYTLEESQQILNEAIKRIEDGNYRHHQERGKQ